MSILRCVKKLLGPKKARRCCRNDPESTKPKPSGGIRRHGIIPEGRGPFFRFGGSNRSGVAVGATSVRWLFRGIGKRRVGLGSI